MLLVLVTDASGSLDADSGFAGYVADEVVGGPDAFLVVARDHESFGDSLLREPVAGIASGPSCLARCDGGAPSPWTR